MTSLLEIIQRGGAGSPSAAALPVDDIDDFGDGHERQRAVGTRMEAHDATGAGRRLEAEQLVAAGRVRRVRRVRQQRRKVVVEHEGRRVVRIRLAADSHFQYSN